MQHREFGYICVQCMVDGGHCDDETRFLIEMTAKTGVLMAVNNYYSSMGSGGRRNVVHLRSVVKKARLFSEVHEKSTIACLHPGRPRTNGSTLSVIGLFGCSVCTKSHLDLAS